MPRSLLFSACFFITFLSQAQTEEPILFPSDSSIQLHSLLDELLAKGVPLIYSKSKIPNPAIKFQKGSYSFNDVIQKMQEKGVTSKKRNDSYVLSWKEIQKTSTYTGYVRDKDSGEVLIGALVYADTGLFAVTNNYGYFSMVANRHVDSLLVRYLGYQSSSYKTNELSLGQNFLLKPALTSLDELVVNSLSQREYMMELVPGSHQIDYDKEGDIPYFLGEVDVLQESLMLPGIKTLGEDASGLHVRGGGSDQNLILLDEAIIYNPNHFFGLISVFNPEAVNQVDILKGYMPAEYGTRGSSIISVKQREGNDQKFSGAGGIGLVSARLLLEGPIKKEKASFLVSARQSIFDLSTNRFDRTTARSSRTTFQDFNLKTNWRVNDKNTLFLSSYLGNDRNVTPLDQSNRWGNNTATLRWNHLWNKKLFSNFTAVISDYSYRSVDPLDLVSFVARANIRNLNWKYNFSWNITDKSELKWGTQILWHRLSPGEIVPFDTLSLTIPTLFEVENGLEHGSYISHTWKINQNLKLDYGLRLTGLTTYGPGRTYLFAPDQERSIQSITDTLVFKSNQPIDQFFRWEPRLLVSLAPTGRGTIKTSVTRAHQFIQLISASVIPSPADLWKLSNSYLQPLRVDQISTGYYHTSVNKEWHFSLEGYYKKYENLIEYKNGADLLLNPLPETELVPAQGRSYGLEFLLQKYGERMSGWLSYTLSRSERRVLSPFENLQVNNGNYYPDIHDKLHDLTGVVKLSLNSKWSLSAAAYYASGRPISFPTGKYEIDGKLVTDYSERNQDRISDYHRVDLSAKWQPENRKSRNWKNTWTASIYNVYARNNAYTYLFRESESNPGETEVVPYSLFGSIIPSVTYNFSF